MKTALILLCALAAPAVAQPRQTVWDGVFSAEQAARGKALFETTCASCHGSDLNGVNRPPLKGESFLNHWMEDSLDELFTRVQSMPPNRANLSEVAYTELLAFLLEANGFPSGKQELKASAIPNIQVQGKHGPDAVPNYSLVEIVGCLEQGPSETWLVTKATEPARTRNPDKPTGEEATAAKAKPLGVNTVQLLDITFFSPAFKPEAHKNQKVSAKGFLIRTETVSRLNVTWVDVLGAGCGR